MAGSESWAYRFLQANALLLLLAVDALVAPAASTQKKKAIPLHRPATWFKMTLELSLTVH